MTAISLSTAVGIMYSETILEQYADIDLLEATKQEEWYGWAREYHVGRLLLRIVFRVNDEWRYRHQLDLEGVLQSLLLGLYDHLRGVPPLTPVPELRGQAWADIPDGMVSDGLVMWQNSSVLVGEFWFEFHEAFEMGL